MKRFGLCIILIQCLFACTIEAKNNAANHKEIKKTKRNILHYSLVPEYHIYQAYLSEQKQVVQIIFCC